MKTIAIIPARGGSKRLPKKNSKILAGKPLVTWTIEAAKSTALIDEVIVSTDDEEIAKISEREGACVPWLRPSNLAADDIKTPAVAKHALDWYEENRGTVDGIILLQPTSPFRTKQTIERGIDLFYNNAKTSVVSVSIAGTHPSWCFRICGDRLQPFYSLADLEKQSQDLTSIYAANGAFYMITPHDLRAFGSFYTNKMVPLLIQSELERIDIDTELDWRIATCVAETL